MYEEAPEILLNEKFTEPNRASTTYTIHMHFEATLVSGPICTQVQKTIIQNMKISPCDKIWNTALVSYHEYKFR